jgi:trimethylamine---corrinoid protein Co-methyltransferase
MEKMLTVIGVTQGGAQYAHCAFGVLERSTLWCPQQAVLDDVHLGVIKQIFKTSAVSEFRRQDVLKVVREVMDSDHKTYMYHLPLPSREHIYTHYPLEGDGDSLCAADLRYKEILGMPRRGLSGEVRQEITARIKGVLPQALA